MADDSFILVNLKDDAAKKLASVIGSKTARSILDYMAQKDDVTASEIAKALKIPLSTAQYNIKHLVEAGLVTNEEFHYSEKGREVDHYKLAQKMVIIAPTKTNFDAMKEKIKNLLPTLAVTAGIAGLIQWVSNMSSHSSLTPVQFAMEAEEAIPMAAQRSAKAVADTASNGATATAEAAMDMAVETAPQMADEAVEMLAEVATEPLHRAAEPLVHSEPSIALWFVAGAVCALALYLIVERIRKK